MHKKMFQSMFWKALFKTAKIRSSLKLGAMVIVPIAVATYLVRTISENFNLWRAAFDILNIEKYYSAFVGFALTAVLAYLVGRFLLSRFFGWFAKKSATLKKIDVFINAKRDKEEKNKGNYRTVLYAEYSIMGSSPVYKIGFWVGNTSVRYPDGAVKVFAQIEKAPPRVGDYLWLDPKYVYLIEGGMEAVADVLISGGYINAEEIDLYSLPSLADATPACPPSSSKNRFQ